MQVRQVGRFTMHRSLCERQLLGERRETKGIRDVLPETQFLHMDCPVRAVYAIERARKAVLV